ncbi:ATP-binding protein [Actinomycetospora lutea]|uniref:ATP-binding protein n=1 Tax=Actinomycetospora lutea TaxID=663604 RepID=UPI003B67A1C1
MLGAEHLSDVLAWLRGDRGRLLAVRGGARRRGGGAREDLADVVGQLAARRAVEVAAAGGHHLLMVGPPGSGKTMLARRMTGLLPDLDVDSALQVAAVRSLAGAVDPEEALPAAPPFVAPHHSVSSAALVGGGSGLARPGAVSLAHSSADLCTLMRVARNFDHGKSRACRQRWQVPGASWGVEWCTAGLLTISAVTFRAREVFVPGGTPTVTYQSRGDLEDQVRRHLEYGTEILAVTGPTKTGKTVLIRHVIPDCLYFRGGQVTSFDDFISAVLDELVVPTEYQRSQKNEDSSDKDRTTRVANSQVGGREWKTSSGAKSEDQASHTHYRSSNTAAQEALLPAGARSVSHQTNQPHPK